MLRVAQVGLHVFYRFNPHAPLNRPEDHRLLASLPVGPGANLRLATAVLEKASDVTVAVSGLAPAPPSVDSKAVAPRPAEASAKTSEPATASQPADAAAS